MNHVDMPTAISDNRFLLSRDSGRCRVTYRFPSQEWMDSLMEVLNSDERYAEVAANWEGDLVVTIEPDGGTQDDHLPMMLYLDLWHGRCREVRVIDPGREKIPHAKFVLRATRGNIVKIFSGDLDPIQAMLTRRLKVEGDMAYMLRNVPTVLDFVRCCRLVPMEGQQQ
jgi:putative sterol carrier protein